jgi:hypothetical protein
MSKAKKLLALEEGGGHDRQSFVLELRAEPGVDGWRALKLALKVLLRGFGLKCTRVRIVENERKSP